MEIKPNHSVAEVREGPKGLTPMEGAKEVCHLDTVKTGTLG